MKEQEGLGMVHLYTGDGKGKTTAAIGLGIRAAGHGYKVLMIQFMKGQINYGELETVKNLKNFEIVQFGRPDFVDRKNSAEIDKKLARDALAFAQDAVRKKKCDLLILDEVCVAVDFGLIKASDVIDLVKSRPEGMELVLTGRYAPKEFYELADTITEMKEVKHPYQKKVLARKGIEY